MFSPACTNPMIPIQSTEYQVVPECQLQKGVTIVALEK